MEGGNARMGRWGGGMGVGVEHHGICAMQTYSQWGSNPRPMAHKTIALTIELREPWVYCRVRAPRQQPAPIFRTLALRRSLGPLSYGYAAADEKRRPEISLMSIPRRMHRISTDLQS